MADRIQPFNHFVQGDEAFCPKCSANIGKASAVERTACRGKLLGRCPTKDDHFHHECPHCGGRWTEATYDRSHEGARIALAAAFEAAERVDMDEDEIVKAWRSRQVRAVMES